VDANRLRPSATALAFSSLEAGGLLFVVFFVVRVHHLLLLIPFIVSDSIVEDLPPHLLNSLRTWVAWPAMPTSLMFRGYVSRMWANK
jgi:hypothetical protein